MTQTFRSLAALVALAALQAAPQPAAAQAKNYGKMPAFAMRDANGKQLDSSKLAGKVLIVDFWATWCPPCKAEIPGLIDLQKKYAARGLQIVGFSVDNNPTDHKTWLAKNAVNYPSIYANTPAGQKVLARFGKRVGNIEMFPTTLVVNAKGDIVYRHIGLASEADFEKILTPLLKKS